VPHRDGDPTWEMVNFFPSPSGTRFMIETFPPGFGVRGHAERRKTMAEVIHADGLVLALDHSDGGNHATSTVDYGVVISGQI
jgi:hypothetical protein